MDAVRVKGEEVAEGDSTLVVIVKQEDEEEGEQLATSFTPSLFIKQEEEDGEGDSVAQTLILPLKKEEEEEQDVLGLDSGTERKSRGARETPQDAGGDEGSTERGRGAGAGERCVGTSRHPGDSLWRCPACQRGFSSSWELTGHCCSGGAAAPSPAKLEFRCPVCGDRFLRPTAFILHKRSHVGQSRYVCPDCGRTTHTLRRLASHRRRHALPHPCRDCARAFRSPAGLGHHRRLRHGAPGAGPEAEGQEQAEAGGGGREDGRAGGDGRFASSHLVQFQSLQCLQCFMTFRDQETTERHLRFKHPAEYERQLRGRTVFACCVCDLTFPSSAQLSAHQRTHSKWSLPPGGLEDSLQRERQGGEWDRGEGGERKVEIPMEERPDPEKQRPSPLQQGSGLSSGAALALRCLQCHIIFTDQHTWDRHMRAKHPSPAGHAPLPPRPPRGQPRPYCCPACGERFIQQGSLTQHYSETHSR
ncbi:zinc finger protein 771-like isoform X1 [Lepisosteus oculatus]|uniref:zinc finger protein 771-like isoform X1 n=1 Tax=Lepisosteus oculatus TaxID=7918 RepID=UPI0037211C88